MTMPQGPGPVDFGDNTLWGRFGAYLLGLLALILWRVVDFAQKRFDAIEARVTAVEKVASGKADTDALSGVASLAEMTRVRDDVGKLFDELREVRTDVANHNTVILEKMHEQNVSQLKAIARLGDRRAHARPPAEDA